MAADLPVESLMPSASLPSLTAAERLGTRRESAGQIREPEEAAKQFEGILLQQIFKQMKETTEALKADEEDEGEEAAFGEQIQSLFWMFLGEQITREGGIGYWKEMVRQWTRQESVQAASDAAGVMRLDERL